MRDTALPGATSRISKEYFLSLYVKTSVSPANKIRPQKSVRLKTQLAQLFDWRTRQGNIVRKDPLQHGLRIVLAVVELSRMGLS
jgi:hypothetical protein